MSKYSIHHVRFSRQVQQPYAEKVHIPSQLELPISESRAMLVVVAYNNRGEKPTLP